MAAFLTADPTEKRLALSEYAEELARSAWEWSARDCVMVVSQWLKRLHNVDPASPFRGSYHSPDEARALIRGLGVFDELVAGALDSLPLQRTSDPEIGDVGLIEAPLHWRNVVPIVGGMVAIRWWDDCWMVTARRGIYVNREFGPITIWRT